MHKRDGLQINDSWRYCCTFKISGKAARNEKGLAFDALETAKTNETELVIFITTHHQHDPSHQQSRHRSSLTWLKVSLVLLSLGS
jgi:hypothetical protein